MLTMSDPKSPLSHMFPWPSANVRKKTCFLTNPVSACIGSCGITETIYQESRVDVGEKVFFTPFQAIGVVSFAVVCSPHIVLSIGLIECIDGSNRSPVLDSC